MAMPPVSQPLIATDADGFWLAAANTSTEPLPADRALYRVSPGMTAAVKVRSISEYGAFWLIASGHTVWHGDGQGRLHPCRPHRLHNERRRRGLTRRRAGAHRGHRRHDRDLFRQPAGGFHCPLERTHVPHRRCRQVLDQSGAERPGDLHAHVDGALVHALLARARADELALLDRISHGGRPRDLADIVRTTWGWLAAKEHRPLLVLWAEAYTCSLTEPDGPWAGFARQTVEDWLGVLTTGQPPNRRRTATGAAERSLALAVLRGSLLDLLATDDLERTTAAVHRHLAEGA